MGNALLRERLSLRAHHLLCLHGFRGLGYDERFVEKMSAVYDRVKSGAGLEIMVIDRPDDICAACPHCTQEGCEKNTPGAEDRVKQLDHRVLHRLGISPGEVFSRDGIISRLLEKINPDDLALVCEGCQWLPFDYCAEGLRDKSLGS